MKILPLASATRFSAAERRILGRGDVPGAQPA